MVARLPRYGTPSEIRIGDTVRLTTTLTDAKMEMVGVVRHYLDRGRARSFTTESGVILGTDWRDGVSKLGVTFLAHATGETQEIPLELFDTLIKELNENENAT